MGANQLQSAPSTCLDDEEVDYDYDGPRAKVIHFIRHAQGVHNVAGEGNKAMYLKAEYFDAPLTELGFQQCAVLREAVKLSLRSVQMIVTSPLTRTIQTTSTVFDGFLDVPRLALECVRERTGLHPCDSRRPVHELTALYHTIDFSHITDDEDALWQSNRYWRERSESLQHRCFQLLSFLYRRPETEIVVVTHSALLDVLFSKIFEAEDSALKGRFDNCELRSCEMLLLQSARKGKLRARVSRPPSQALLPTAN